MNRFRQYLNRLQMHSSTSMVGRNGQDQLARASYLAGVVCLIVSLLAHVRFLSTISLLLLGYALFRMYSRNIAKRRLENEKYLKLTYKPRRFFRGLVMEWKDRKSYKYYSCPKCRQRVRVPKGRGNIEILCPKCGNKYIRKT